MVTNMKFANLHLHSNYSDGAFTPEQLVYMVKSMGYKAIALTDHDTFGGVNETLEAAKLEGMEAISGIEFICNVNGIRFDITGLDFDMNDPGIKALANYRCEAYAEYTKISIERAVENGYLHDITWKEIVDFCDEGMWICVDQVWSLLKKKKIIPRVGEAWELRSKIFEDPISKSHYPPLTSAEEVIRTIRKAGGVACLAHPQGTVKYLPELIAMGLNGVEVSHPDLDSDPHPLAAYEASKAYKLYRSGGTDHTGVLSGCGGDLAIPAYHGIDEEDYYILKERRLG